MAKKYIIHCIFIFLLILQNHFIVLAQKKDSIGKVYYDSTYYNKILSLKDSTSIIVFGDKESPSIRKIETNYSIESGYFDDDNNDKHQHYLIKRISTTEGDFDSREILNKKIDITVYKNFSLKDTFSFSKVADKVELDNFSYNSGLRLWEVTKYGCCLNPTIIELTTLNPQKSILRSETNFYAIEFPNFKDVLLLGYLGFYKGGADSCIIGQVYYSLNGLTSDTINIKVKAKTYVDDIKDDFTKVSFITKDNKQDYSNEYKVRKEYYFESGNIKAFKEARGIGLIITYSVFIKGTLTEKKVRVVFDKGKPLHKEILFDWDISSKK